MKFTIVKNGKSQEIELPDCTKKLNKVLGNKIFSVSTVPNIAITKYDRDGLLGDIQELVFCMGSQLYTLKRAYET
jgi:uncharacterized protein involved in tellurium resistance